jgi:LmbE family N-acetylglucosaminyl deacetylase
MKKVLALIILFAGLGAAAAVPTGSLLEGVKPGPDGKIDVVTMFPHQDDETIFVGGTILKMKHENPNVRVHIVCFTLGELSSAKDTLKITPEFQGKIRTQELRAAATVLGADEVIQLDYHDQGLSKAPFNDLVQKALDEIDNTGAEVVVTYGPDGMSGHIDHRTLSKAVAQAFPQSHAQKLYYAAMPDSFGRIYKAYNKIGYTKAEFKVDIRKYKELKKLALYEHSTQKFFSGKFTSPSIEMLYNNEWFRLGASN